MYLIQRSTENEKPHQRKETPVDPDFYRVIFIQNKNNNTWKKSENQFSYKRRATFSQFLIQDYFYIQNALLKKAIPNFVFKENVYLISFFLF